MTTKNCARLLLAILLLFSGTSPVLAQTPDQCASVQPARPGDILTDALSDVPAAHIDIARVETSLSGETLTAVFHLKALPETLRFNRSEFGRGAKEYQWEVAVDVDNDRGTGPGGFDILLTAYHIAFLSHEESGADVTAPLQEMLEASVWETNPNGSTGTLAAADLAVSPEDNTITLIGNIPGITPASRLTFSAYDVEFAAEADQIECHPSYIRSRGPWGCNAAAALALPGQTVTAETGNVIDPYMDITALSASLSGERLTAVFHLRDLPETLTFNRAGTPQNVMEYAWVVVIDVDGDRATGAAGFEYQLLASHSVPPSAQESNVSAPVETKAEARVWSLHAGSAAPPGRAVLEASAEEDTITLTGDIPGITPAARLAFRTYDYYGNADEVGCFNPQLQITLSSQCLVYAAFPPGQTVTDEAADAPAAHIDLTRIETALSGETLTVVFHLRDIPQTLTFNRTGIAENYKEYGWDVSIDIDGDQETGNRGIEYLLSASHFVPASRKGSNAQAPIESGLEANVLKARPDGFVFMSGATLAVFPEENTLTLTGTIPGITQESRLTFKTYDYTGGSDEIGCQDPSASQASADGPAAGASQELAGHIDVRDIAVALDGETLTVTFHLRDLPETLTFDRSGVPANALEYSWEVSIDVDNDRATGPGGYDYMLSAGYFVHPLVKGSNTAARMTDPGFVTARILGLDAEGNRRLAAAAIVVSAADNTITLTGKIPGITAESPLRFRAYDHLSGSFQTPR